LSNNPIAITVQSVMAITDEKIASLKREYTVKIQDALAQVDVWNGVANQFKTRLEILNELVVGTNGTPKLQERSLGTAVGKYAGMEATPAVLAVLEDSSEALATSDIIKILENEGFNTEPEHWKAAIFTACSRLAAKGKIMSLQRNGKAAYLKKT